MTCNSARDGRRSRRPLHVLLTVWLAATGGVAANEPPLTAAQVAQLAYDQGFRGGSLVAAVAAASAESSFDPDAVCNNLHVLDGGGQPMYDGNGRPVLATISAYDGTMIPVGEVRPLPGGGQGRVVSHCRGLWQINDLVHPTIPDEDAFTPSTAARRAWGISRKGRFWGKWTSVMTGAAWESSRLTVARAAARSVDPGVLPGTGLAGLRVEAWTSGGGVRTTAGGAFLRPITRGDTGTILEGPVIAAITQGLSMSRHLWYRVQWDHGTTGWVVEEYLFQRSAGPVLSALPAYDPVPANGTVRVPSGGTVLRWTIGGNTKSIRLRFGADPALSGAETIRLSGGMQTEWATGALEFYRNYYWRVESESGNGTFVQGPTWTFRTEPFVHPVTVSDLAVAPSPVGRGQSVTISGKIAAMGSQPLLIGANIGSYSDPARDLPFTAHPGGGPTDFSRSFHIPADMPLGNYPVEVAVWFDANGNGKIEHGDVRLFRTNPGSIEVRDVTPPTFTALSAGPATVRPGETVTLSATVRDSGGSGLTTVYFYRGTGEIAPISWQIIAARAASGDGPVTVTVQDIPSSESLYWYEMEVVDAANNRTRQRVSTTVRATIPDLAPPTVQWLAPANGITVAGSFITVTGQATDDRGVAFVRYRLNGGAWVQTSSALWSANIDLVPGSNVLEAVATDRAGKQSAVAKLQLYFLGNPSDPSVFDEQFGFDGDEVPPRWQLQVTGSPEQNGVLNGRLEAAGGGTAAIQANKTVPNWARAVELRFAPGDGAGMWWRDNQLRIWRVALRNNFLGQHTVEVGFDSTLQQIPVPAPPWGGAVNRVRTVWRDGSIHLWYLAQDSTTPVVRELAFPQLRLARMSGPMEFRAESSFGGVGAIVLDDVQLRALRQEDLFAIHFLDARPGVPGQTSKVRWASFAGRNYAVEISPGLAGSWSQVTQTTGDGLVTERSFPMPAGPRRFVRIRELP